MFYIKESTKYILKKLYEIMDKFKIDDFVCFRNLVYIVGGDFDKDVQIMSLTMVFKNNRISKFVYGIDDDYNIQDMVIDNVDVIRNFKKITNEYNDNYIFKFFNDIIYNNDYTFLIPFNFGGYYQIESDIVNTYMDSLPNKQAKSIGHMIQNNELDIELDELVVKNYRVQKASLYFKSYGGSPEIPYIFSTNLKHPYKKYIKPFDHSIFHEDNPLYKYVYVLNNSLSQDTLRYVIRNFLD